jgi:hypothetical protein
MEFQVPRAGKSVRSIGNNDFIEADTEFLNGVGFTLSGCVGWKRKEENDEHGNCNLLVHTVSFQAELTFHMLV